MRPGAIALALIVSACGGERAEPYDPRSDNHGFGYQADGIGIRGLRLRWRPFFDDRSRFTHPGVYEEWFDEVQLCTGLFAPMPFVIYVPPGALDPLDGHYLSGPPLIRLEVIGWFKHESIHYLLDVNAGDLDPGHKSPLFSKCEEMEI